MSSHDNHVFKGIAVATNVDSIAAAALTSWLAQGLAVDSTWSPADGWTHRIVEVAR